MRPVNLASQNLNNNVWRSKAMYSIDEKIFHDILKKKSIALVGKSCKRIEVIRDNLDNQPNLSFYTKCNIFRDLIKELIYESMRDVEDTVSAFSNGTTINVKFERPISK
jgi:hypothetical protein